MQHLLDLLDLCLERGVIVHVHGQSDLPRGVREAGGADRIGVQLLDFAARVLRRAGIAAECVTTAPAAITALQQRRYDLAILDIQLGSELSGWDVLHEVHRTHPEQRVLICSGNATADEALGRGAIGIIHKPFEAETLERVVREAIRAGREAAAAA